MMFDVRFVSIDSTAFGVQSLRILRGQTVEISRKVDVDVKWFSDNDKVLRVDDSQADGVTKAVVSCDEVGTSTLLLLDRNKTEIANIVVEVISEQAVSLGMTTEVTDK